MIPVIVALLVAATPYREPFLVAPSQPSVERVTTSWYLAPARTCYRAYKVDEWCVEDGEPVHYQQVSYIPASRPVVFYAFGLDRGQFVRVFVRSWYAGAVLVGYGGSPLSVIVYPQPGENVTLQAASQPTCEGCQ